MNIKIKIVSSVVLLEELVDVRISFIEGELVLIGSAVQVLGARVKGKCLQWQ